MFHIEAVPFHYRFLWLPNIKAAALIGSAVHTLSLGSQVEVEEAGDIPRLEPTHCMLCPAMILLMWLKTMWT